MRWTVKIDNGDQFFVGSGESLQEAIDDALLQISILETPKRGPGIWES